MTRVTPAVLRLGSLAWPRGQRLAGGDGCGVGVLRSYDARDAVTSIDADNEDFDERQGQMHDADPDEAVFVVEEDTDDGGYTATCHRFGIFTQGEDLDDLRAMVRDAIACRFPVVAERPVRVRLHFVRDEVLA